MTASLPAPVFLKAPQEPRASAGLDGDASDRHAQVRAGPPEAMHVARHVLAGLPEDLVHGVPRPAGGLPARSRRAEKEQRSMESGAVSFPGLLL